ncbi:MAG: hypothetical protein IJ281_06025 [Clostridia bacterium]|nr:hypothetical protein [Clostridia bacterium]
MSANFEIMIFTEKYACPSFAEDALRVLGVRGITSPLFSAAKDWFFTESAPVANGNDTQAFIDAGNILRIDFPNRDNTNCGMFVSMENGLYQYSLWCSCLHPSLDQDEIDGENRAIYESLYQVIVKWIEQGALANYVIVAMGTELFFDTELPLRSIVSGAKNVCAWIVHPAHRDWIDDSMPGYTKHNDGYSCGEIWEKRT